MTTLEELKEMTRSDIESRFEISGKKGKEGTTFRAGQYAVKLFKPTKASAKIKKEAGLQSKAAEYGVAPKVHFYSEIQKFIVMDALEETIVERGRRDNWTELPPQYAAQLYALCNRLDAAKVVQNDGNPLNLMLDENGRMYIIDYGFAKKIDDKVLTKRGPQPNVDLTLWHFSRQLRYYKFKNNLLDIVQAYRDDNEYVDRALLAAGEELLGPRPSVAAAPMSELTHGQKQKRPVFKQHTSSRARGRERIIQIPATRGHPGYYAVEDEFQGDIYHDPQGDGNYKLYRVVGETGEKKLPMFVQEYDGYDEEETSGSECEEDEPALAPKVRPRSRDELKQLIDSRRKPRPEPEPEPDEATCVIA